MTKLSKKHHPRLLRSIDVPLPSFGTKRWHRSPVRGSDVEMRFRERFRRVSMADGSRTPQSTHATSGDPQPHQSMVGGSSITQTPISHIPQVGIRGHRLDGYLNGTKIRPDEFVTVTNDAGDSIPEVNPAFEAWIVHDQLLLGWLYRSMTESIATEVMGCDSSAALWRALEILFGAHSKLKMDEYRTKIQTTQKGSLDIEYLPIVLMVEAKPTTTWQELQDTLLSFDSKFERLSAISGVPKTTSRSPSPSANLAATRPSSSQGGRGSTSNHFRSGNRGGSHPRGGGGSRGRGCGGRSSGNSKPTCQICGRYGHSVAYCYNRYEEAYMGSTPTNGQNNNEKGAQGPWLLCSLHRKW
uniref:Uncharacterized protein n=1 Tax=Cannabis sativa TaxID=3483 RepID=A0A803PL25_CANSA